MLLLAVVSFLAGLFIHSELYFCLFFAFLFVLIIGIYVYYIQKRSFQKVERMIEAIRYEDFSLNFVVDGKDSMEVKLVEDINGVMEKFRMQLAEKQERYQYYNSLLDTVDTCMLVANKDGEVLWMNRTAMYELCGHQLHLLDELKVLNKDFPVLLEKLLPGEVKVVRIYKEEMMQDMAVTVTEYANNREFLRLINLKNIRTLLEENEMEAWQKLVRVLTHEIMNSITPIIS
jgi:nitrogen fixation/metabolism regulation signal transduction histidine kinase